MPPRGTRALRCSSCQAVTPLVTSATASSAGTCAGSTTASSAASSTCSAQAPVRVIAATRCPGRQVVTPGPVATTSPTRS
ncbi:hypothetical protein [Saccharopolyspora sp. 6V]|uniref:zinc finger domain-containing protein n=1 Tax=unclassified Saccharopolyspora TaxID=2646250 RepID=UPI0035A8603F